MNKRIDLHMHSLFSDGELLPSELARRAANLNHEVIAITDHVDYSNVEQIPQIQKAIDGVAKKAKDLGAQIVVVHGETLNEPVIEGTNYAAVNSEYVDILGHPGLITYEEAQIAKENGIYLEISARSGHCLGNGHVANIASEVGNKLLVNTDTHSPDNLITFEKSYEIALGAGLSKKEAMAAIVDNPRELLKSKGIL